LNNYWSSRSGFEANLSAPFYIGRLQTGLIYLPFKKRSENYPDFNSFLFYAQWGYKFDLPFKFIISIDALTGIYQMVFEESAYVSISQGEIAEREITMGLASTIGYEIISTWNLTLSFSYLRIYTSRKIDLLNISFGLRKTFTSPDWLTDFLE
jgi:hypothetical protein